MSTLAVIAVLCAGLAAAIWWRAVRTPLVECRICQGMVDRAHMDQHLAVHAQLASMVDHRDT